MCGSVLGLLSMESTATYFPPICKATLPYSFSAATTTIFPLVEPPLAVGRGAESDERDYHCHGKHPTPAPRRILCRAPMEHCPRSDSAVRPT